MLTNEQFGHKAHQLITTANFAKRQPTHQWAKSLALTFLQDINYEICEQTIGQAEILRLDDKYIKYLLCMPYQSYEGQDRDQFMWLIGTDPNNDDDGITPDDANIYFIEKKFPGLRIEDIK